ncbi:MAG: magnesium transporter CorA [Clostridia bacterium]|nr:magnesium transporter CorA [Clostridia bacterium]
MPFYKIRETLCECDHSELREGGAQYVALLSGAEWRERRDSFDMGIDVESSLDDRTETKAVVNIDSLTGSFCIPDRGDITGVRHSFAFALDEKGIVLIDDEGYAGTLIEKIRRTKKWKLPGLERFMFDLLESIVSGDLKLLGSIEKRLSSAEDEILKGDVEEFPIELNDIRGELLDLRMHYEQLIDFSQELEENENGFFSADGLRYFRLYTERIMRLQDSVTSLREYVVQLRDLVQNRLEVKQNKIITLLTVITSIFMPLTLIAGWYGMNFKYMPELDRRWAYPVVIGVSIAIVVGCLIWFKKKKWM